jgi:hypothetical protein
MEEPADSGRHFHERATFKAVVAVVGLLAGIWAFVGAPTPWKVADDITSSSLPLWNTEIILDSSSQMGTAFGDGTKLEVAVAAVGRYAAADEEIGLALRKVGAVAKNIKGPSWASTTGTPTTSARRRRSCSRKGSRT